MPVYTQNTKGPQSQLSLHTICGILWQFQAVYYICDATCFSNVAISTLKYFQLHPIFSPIAPQCQIPIWYVFFLLLPSLHPKCSKCCGVMIKSLQKKSELKLHISYLYMSTFTLLVGILPPSTLRIFEGRPVKKYTLCVCLKKHSITNRNIICFKKSL